jgi:GntR family transcriptional regulator
MRHSGPRHRPGDTDRLSAPKYQRVKSYVRQGIASRRFTDAVPSENQLARIFNVSRMTARRALVELEQEGIVERIPGKGTFVRAFHHYTRGFFKVRPFRRWAEDLGVTMRAELIESGIIDPPADVVQKLNYDGLVILLKIMNYFDEIPVRFAIRHLRADLCAGIIDENLESESIHDILINTYGLPLTTISQSMTAIGLPPGLATIFNAPAGSPFFYFRRLTYSFETPVTYVEYYMRGDMAFEDTFTPQFDPDDFDRSGS